MSKDIADQLIEDIENEILTTTAHTRKVSPTKKIKVRSSAEKARDDYKIAKRHHREEIKRIKKEIALAKRVARNNVKAHRNMIATAKTTYKAIKLAQR